MKRIIRRFYKSKGLKFFIIPFALLVLWIALTLSYMYNYNESFTVISFNQSPKSFKETHFTHLLKGQKISGIFTAKENYLGIVSVKFIRPLDIPYYNQDILVFRIKELGAAKWYAQNYHKSGVIYNVQLLPFGFPTINNSKNKKYYFEIESLNGNIKNGIELSANVPNLITKYQIPKKLLLSNKDTLKTFIWEKISTSFETPEIIFTSFVYMIPFIFYLIYLSPINTLILSPKIFKPLSKIVILQMIKFKNIIITYPMIIIIFVIILDIFYLQIIDDWIYVLLTITSIVVLKPSKQGSKYSFIFSISLFIVTSILYLFGNEVTGFISSSWAYMFAIAGTLQILIENGQKNRAKILK